MNQKSDIDNEMKGLILFWIVSLGCGGLIFTFPKTGEDKTSTAEDLIIQIYDEVREMGLREGEDFINRDFHFDLDGRKQNREEHILVFGYSFLEQQIFSIQITYYEDEGSKSYQGRAEKIKDIDCVITDGEAEIKQSRYSKKEIQEILPKILDGIKKEKELLKLIRKSA